MKKILIAFTLVLSLVSVVVAVQDLDDQQQSNHLIQEDFQESVDSLEDGYGKFQYSSTNEGEAHVADGKLFMDGDHPDGDQLLFITSQSAIGEDQFPRKVELTAQVGSKERGNTGAWHVGIFIGNVKLVLHPGFAGGGVRVETIDEHKRLLKLGALPFKPADGVLYELKLKVIKLESGCLLQVTIRDPASDATLKGKLRVMEEDLGEFNRIGLARSGRPGADAMFGSLKIQLDR